MQTNSEASKDAAIKVEASAETVAEGASASSNATVMAAGGTGSPGGQDGSHGVHARKKPRKASPKRIALGILVGLFALAMVVVIAFVAYMRIAYASFYGMATAAFDTPGINTGFIPQDLDRADDGLWLFSGYESDGEPSPIWRRGDDGTVSRIQVQNPDGSPYMGHGGGITSAFGNVYLTTEGGLLVLSADEVASASEGQAVKASAKVDVGFDPAFVNVQDDVLYTGVFYMAGPYETPDSMHLAAPDGTENHAVMYAYGRDASSDWGFADVPEAVYSIPDKVQGMAMTPDGRMVLSTSWGFSPSVMYAYDVDRLASGGTYDVSGNDVPLVFCDASALAASIEAPPMMEGIDQFDGRLFLSNESASNKYIFGKLYGGGTVYWIEP